MSFIEYIEQEKALLKQGFITNIGPNIQKKTSLCSNLG